MQNEGVAFGDSIIFNFDFSILILARTTIAQRKRSDWRSQLTTPGDCLSKTQLRANSKEDVYGVTLVRCRNVNG